MKTRKLKPKKCKECGVEFQPFNSLQTRCSVKCAMDYAKRIQGAKVIKENKDKQKQENKKKKEGLEKLKTLSDYEKEARRVFQKWIRRRDEEHPCISCGTPKSKIWDGSHYLKAEIFSGLIFNEMNVHKACRKCNYFLDGNELGYREGLIKRYGIDYVNELESLKATHRDYKYTKEELKEIKRKYLKKLKEFK